MVSVQVTTLAGDCLTFQCKRWTLRDLKDAIKRATGIRMREQRLISGAQEMHEDELLTDGLHLTLIRRPLEQVRILEDLEDRDAKRVLQKVPEQYRADREVMLAAAASDATCISMADKTLRECRDFILAVLKRNGMVLKFLDVAMQEDPELCLAAVNQNGYALQHVAPHCQSKSLVLAAVSTDGEALQFASHSQRADQEVVLAAVEQYSWSFQYAAEDLKFNREFLLLTMACNGRALQHLSDEWKKDPDIVLAAVSEFPGALRFADPDLRSCKSFVLALFQRRACTLKYPVEELWEDRDFVLQAVQIQSSSFQAASAAFRADPEIAMLAAQRHGYTLQFASNELRAEKRIVLAAVRQYASALAYAPELQEDREVVETAVRRNGCSLRYAAQRLREDKELVLLAVRQQGFALQFAGERLQVDHEAATETAPEKMSAWFSLASAMMSDADWEVADARPDASLSHRSCPWGGHLIKIDLKMPGFDPPLVETLAPGDALVEQPSQMFILRMAALLFGNFARHGPFMQKGCLEARTFPVLARHQLRRDFPEEGDSSYAVFTSDGVGQEQITICRNTEKQQHFRIVLVFSTPTTGGFWVDWTSPSFQMLTDTTYTVMHWYMNRPGVQQMRAIDENFYVCLALRNYNRGPPMIPDECGTTAIRANGWQNSQRPRSWTRFQPGDGKFRLAEYLKCFTERLGHGIPAFDPRHCEWIELAGSGSDGFPDTLDGKVLVPYQCVVLRRQWESIRDYVQAALTLQRAAYRRANGGSRAPSLTEDASLRYAESAAQQPVNWCAGELKAPWTLEPAWVLRKTTLECDEETNESNELVPVRKTKSESTTRMVVLEALRSDLSTLELVRSSLWQEPGFKAKVRRLFGDDPDVATVIGCSVKRRRLLE
eukprot:s3145_g6.t1